MPDSPTTPDACRSFVRCGAPICPLSSTPSVWFPDEPTCTLRGAGRTWRWVRTQRKITRRASERDRYYTRAMLEAVRAVGAGARGLDPSAELGRAEGQESTFLVHRG